MDSVLLGEVVTDLDASVLPFIMIFHNMDAPQLRTGLFQYKLIRS